ncbi:MAG: hypothetical protein ABSG20_11070 [Bradyrhizobium sp.]
MKFFRALAFARPPGSAGSITAVAARPPRNRKSLKNYTKGQELQM